MLIIVSAGCLVAVIDLVLKLYMCVWVCVCRCVRNVYVCGGGNGSYLKFDVGRGFP